MMQGHRFSAQRIPLYFLFVLVACVRYTSSLISKAELPKELEDCYRSYFRWSLREVVGEQICWSCEAPTIHRLRKNKPPEQSASAKAYIKHLMEKFDNIFNGRRFKRQATPPCIRKEYRMLTDEERNLFHYALNVLKNDTSVTPNRYDMLASMHSGRTLLRSAHGGPNFLGWHRVFLLLMEDELQTVDPSICLPYWDSSIDDALGVGRRPSSPIFSPQFLGRSTPNGPVETGPFTGWQIPGFGPLTRNVRDIELFSARGINNILSQTRTRQVTRPEGNPENVIEAHHDRVHNFIGGQMNQLERSAHDPAFFLHHCFVDYVWELFRMRQREISIDPQLDYPWPLNPPLPLHDPDREMGFPSRITNRQGYSDNLTRTYQYELSPTCPSCGGSRYLLCNTQINRCIPVDPNVGIQAVTAGQDSSLPRSSEPTEIQNTFCVDGICDMREWVYVPVEVISARSPDLQTYYSFPFYNGSIWRKNDIYQPSAYSSTSRYFRSRNPKGYDKCEGNGMGQIFIQSQGLSYDGFYKESVIIDQRLATSHAVGYLAVKSPKNGPVKTMFRAFDSCGRLCRTAFKTPGTERYETFSGVLDISDVPGRSRQYSFTYGLATLDTWGYSSNDDCPSFINDDIVFAFYCDYPEEIPWIKKGEIAPLPDPPSQKSAPESKTNECKIDAGCTIDVPCDTVNNPASCVGERYKCRSSCNEYVECANRQFWKMCCPYGWSFSIWSHQCTPHQPCYSF